jgi:NTE family protein
VAAFGVDHTLAMPWSSPAVVFSGGGTLGAVQVGIIDVLERRRLRPSMVVGTSAGALNAAFWAFNPGPGAAGRLLGAWCRCGRTTLLTEGRFGVVCRLLMGRDHLHGQHELARVLAAALGRHTRIEDAPIPLLIVVADALTGARHVLRSGPLLPALLASCAIPGLFGPVTIDGRPFIDGGVVANCDVEAAADAGAGEALAIELIGETSGPSRNVMDAVRRAVVFSLRRQTEQARLLAAARLRLALLRVSLDDPPGLGDFRRTRDLFRVGRRAGELLVRTALDATGRVRPGSIEFRTARDGAGRPALRRHAVEGAT